jgi:tape measure domain-containing protein
LAQKTLTAKVKVDTKSAEASLARLEKKIKQINKVVNIKVGKSSIEKQTERAVLQQEKLRQATLKTQLAEEKLTTQKQKTALATQKVKNNTDKSVDSANKLSAAFSRGNSSANGLLSTVKRVASVYLGVMGARSVINTADTITSAQNRLNSFNGNNTKLTAESMDKIYAAAQRSRSSYGGMLDNVSKSMVLAGDSFQGEIDNAIRFQEIMSKAYTVGGASDAEAHSSMYQLVQALGSGVLQGDELRSVREGAPLAYKAIEKFAQGVFDTEESLKDLASQGVITSDIIVAALLDKDFTSELEEKFNKTQVTFAQTWEGIKNTATKAFEPVLQKLTKMLNSDKGKKAIDNICNALVVLADTILWIFGILGKFVNWCADNWEWLKKVLVGALILIISYLITKMLVSVACAIAEFIAWAMANMELLAMILLIFLVIAAVLTLLYIFYKWKQGALNTLQAIGYGLLVLAALFWLLGLSWLAIFLLVIALLILYFAEFCGYVNVGIQAIKNAWFWLCNLAIGVWNWCVAALGNGIAWFGNLFMGCINWISALWNNCIAGIVNVGMGLWNVLNAVCQNIGIAFQNAWAFAGSTFWEFIADCLDGLSKMTKIIEIIAKALGADFSIGDLADDLHDKANRYKQKEYVSVGDAWESGMNTRTYQNLGDAWDSGYNTYSYSNLGDAWSRGWDTYDTFQNGWASDAYNSGYEWGAGVEDKINQFGSKFQNQDGGSNLLDNFNNGLIDPNDAKYGVGGKYDPSGANADILSGLDKLNGTTEDIKDSIDLTDDDLDFLRRIAEMEWRNEFTTAEIKVDMTNHNSVNSDRDLDGIVSYLSDVLREEMTNVAYGVHY